MSSARQTFLFRLTILVLSLLLVGVASRSAGINEGLPGSRVIEGLVLPVPRSVHWTAPVVDAFSAGGTLLDAAARVLVPAADGRPIAQPRLATSSSTR